MGYLFAECFVKEGGNVVLTGRDRGRLESAVNAINAIRAGSAIGVPCDVRDYEQVCAVRDAAVEAFGSIDVLVNFAGGSEIRMLGIDKSVEFPDVPIEVYEWGLDVNLKGQLYFDHAVLKQMREQKSGVIIHLGSIVGEEGSASTVAYSAAKSGAMHGLTRSVALYGGKYGIRCNCISPGPVLTRPGMAGKKTLLGRAAETQEIVDLILFVASDKAAFLTGEDILIDGGRRVLRNKT